MMLSIVFCVGMFVSGAISNMITMQECCSHIVENGNKEEEANMRERIQVLEDKQNGLIKLLFGEDSDFSEKEEICYMGVKSGEIPDSAMTASSQWSDSFAAYYGRLDKSDVGGYKGMWHAARGRAVVGEWIQVDFGSPLEVGGVITQGQSRPNIFQWVTSYKISCGNTVDTMAVVTENGTEKIFSGNTDNNGKVYNRLPKPLTCRYIRVYPQTFHGYMTMRIEFVKGSCYDYFKL